jgi:peptide deformylase
MNNGGKELRICTYPDPVLRVNAASIENIDGELQTLIEDMIVTMYLAPGIGLAANQVGEAKRLIVVDLYPGKDERKPCVLINPEIVLREGEVIREEACLSVIDYAADVTRSAQVKVRGVDRHGKPMEIDAEGLLAICLQHEIDHLSGILYIDHISALKRALYKKRLKKKAKQAEIE